MKKLLGLSAVLLAGLSFSSLSYGFGMSCEAPSIPHFVMATLPITLNFSCTNTGPVAYGSFHLVPTTSEVTVDHVVCPDNTHIAEGDVCSVTATFVADHAGRYAVNFDAHYGSDIFPEIFGSQGLSIGVSHYSFSSTHSPFGGADQIFKASNGTMYAVNQGELYQQNNEGSWVVLPLPTTIDEITNNLRIADSSCGRDALASDNEGNIYVLMDDAISVWEYNITTHVWRDTHSSGLVEGLRHFNKVISSGQATAAILHRQKSLVSNMRSVAVCDANFTAKSSTFSSIHSLMTDSSGHVYAEIRNDSQVFYDLLKYDGSSWVDTQFTGGDIEQVIADHRGDLYVLDSLDELWKYQSDSWLQMNGPTVFAVMQIAVDSASNLYVLTLTEISPSVYDVWKYSETDHSWVNTGVSSDILGGADGLSADSVGNIYVLSQNDIFQYPGTGTTWVNTAMNAAISNLASVNKIIPDNAGNIYVTITDADGQSGIWKYPGRGTTWTNTDLSTGVLRVATFSVIAGDSNNLYLINKDIDGNGDLWQYQPGGNSVSDWIEANDGLPLDFPWLPFGENPMITLPNPGALLTMTSAGVQKHEDSAWSDSLPLGPYVENQRYPSIQGFYEGDSAVYAHVALDANKNSDTLEDLLEYHDDSSWQSLNFPSEAHDNLHIVDSVTFNRDVYVAAVNKYGSYSVWMYQSNAGWTDTVLPGDTNDILGLVSDADAVYLLRRRGAGYGDDYYIISQYKDGSWSDIYTTQGDTLESLLSDGNHHIYTIIDGINGTSILQYNTQTTDSLSIESPVSEASLLDLMIDHSGNLYVLTVNHHRYNVWVYNTAAEHPVWTDTQLDVASKQAIIYNLYAKNDYVYASTQSGVYAYNFNGKADVWAQLDDKASSLLSFDGRTFYSDQQVGGIYQAKSIMH